jgi:hypothetical protein
MLHNVTCVYIGHILNHADVICLDDVKRYVFTFFGFLLRLHALDNVSCLQKSTKGPCSMI